MSINPMFASRAGMAGIAAPAAETGKTGDGTTPTPPPAGPLPWNDLLSRPRHGSKSEGITLAKTSQAPGQPLTAMNIRIDDSWLTRHRSRYNDEGDALLRAMLTAFRQGTPLANASATYDSQQRLLQFDFLHGGLQYHVRAIVHEDGRITDIHITEEKSEVRCLQLSEQGDGPRTSAMFKRAPQRGGASSALYQMYNASARTPPPAAPKTTDRTALLSLWKLHGDQVALAELIAGIETMALHPELETLAYFGLLEQATAEADKDFIADRFASAVKNKPQPYAASLASEALAEQTEIHLLKHFAFACLMAQRLARPPDRHKTSADAAHDANGKPADEQNEEDEAAAAGQARASLEECLAVVSRFYIDPDRIFRKMEPYLPDYRRVLDQLEKASQALREKLGHRDARIAMLLARQHALQENVEREGREDAGDGGGQGEEREQDEVASSEEEQRDGQNESSAPADLPPDPDQQPPQQQQQQQQQPLPRPPLQRSRQLTPAVPRSGMRSGP